MYATTIFIVLVVVSVASGSPFINTRLHNINRIAPIVDESKVNLDLCPNCINEAIGVINILLNAILDEGILANCGDLCGVVTNRTGSKALGDICLLVCDGLGLDEFIKGLIKLDLDPIYYCEIAKMCPINDQSDAKFANFSVSPSTGNRRTKFVLDCSFATKNGTGTGMLRLSLFSPKTQTATTDLLIEAVKPGSYAEKIPVDIFDQNYDSSIGLSDDWPVGTYNITAQLCYGECESHHPHSAIYDTGKSSFTVTN
jgi:hypothetical protein